MSYILGWVTGCVFTLFIIAMNAHNTALSVTCGAATVVLVGMRVIVSDERGPWS